MNSIYQAYANRRTNVTFDPHLGDTRSVAYQWNGFARLKKITDLGGETTTFGYNLDLQRAATSISTGLAMAQSYQLTHESGALSFSAANG